MNVLGIMCNNVKPGTFLCQKRDFGKRQILYTNKGGGGYPLGEPVKFFTDEKFLGYFSMEFGLF